MVGMFGCWGCAAGAAGVGATTQLTYRIAQYDANWFPLGVALWSVVLITGSEAAFLWEFQAGWRSAFTFLSALVTLYFLYKSVRVHSLVLCASRGVACRGCRSIFSCVCVCVFSLQFCTPSIEIMVMF